MAYFVTAEFGIITENNVTFNSSTFMATPPTFTLYGDTAGGPPVEYTWTRDGIVITNSGIKPVPQVRWGGRNISPTIIVNERNVNAFYQSTLTVTARLPGLYQYSVTNKAMIRRVNSTFIIEGKYSYLS